MVYDLCLSKLPKHILPSPLESVPWGPAAKRVAPRAPDPRRSTGCFDFPVPANSRNLVGRGETRRRNRKGCMNAGVDFWGMKAEKTLPKNRKLRNKLVALW